MALETDNLYKAEREFEKLSKTNIDASVILYDSSEDTVIRVSIQSEPIFLVRAVELARNRTDHIINWLKAKAKSAGEEGAQMAMKMGIKGGASFVIGQMSTLLSGAGPVPGIGSAVMGHFFAPYYAVKGDGTKAGGAAAGMYGSMTGAIAGPPGALIGGIIGGATFGAGATALIRAASHPNQCKDCKGTGLRGNYYRCPDCDGYGYRKG